MSGVYIKGIKLPTIHEGQMIIRIDPDGKADVQWSGMVGGEYTKAVEVHHYGDLIDREALKLDLGITDFDCKKCGWYKETPFPYCSAELDDTCFALENAEAVIPADRSEASLCDGCDEQRENCSWCKRMERSEDG